MKMRKFLSLVLSLCVLLSCFSSLAVSAAGNPVEYTLKAEKNGDVLTVYLDMPKNESGVWSIVMLLRFNLSALKINSDSIVAGTVWPTAKVGSDIFVYNGTKEDAKGHLCIAVFNNELVNNYNTGNVVKLDFTILDHNADFDFKFETMNKDSANHIGVNSTGTSTDRVYYDFTCSLTNAAAIPEGHQVTEWKVTKSPTCTAVGRQEGVCTVCDTKVTKPLAALGHKEEVVAGKAPTCTEAGYEGGWVCLVCEDFTVIPALGHDGCRYGQEEPIHPDTIVPSCEEQGYCGICGEYGELPVGHTPRKEATCTTKAVCKECGEEYGEPNGHRYSDSFAYCLMCGAPKVDLYINKEND